VADSGSSRKLRYFLVGVIFLLIGWSAVRGTVDDHLRAMSLLMRFSDPDAKGFSTRFAKKPFTQETTTVQTSQGPLKYRLYIPQGVENPPAIVVLHGIHNLGLEEPRLIRFANAAAGAGMLAMTPELTDLADYQVTPKTIDTIGKAAEVLSLRTGHKVGVIGLSFAGGLALLAAEKPEYAGKIGFVVTVGSHDDMGRVARFFAGDMAERPDGSKEPFSAHEYGALVLAYTHLDGFFAARDIPAAGEALKLWLWEKPEDARGAAKALSPAGQAEFEKIIHHRGDLKPELMQEIQRHSADMDAVSPHGKISDLKVPVFVLHGTADNVIPASESEWLAKDIPPADLKRVLLSPALIHVHLEDSVPFSQKWDLIDFMAAVLDAAKGLEKTAK
jgi:pimeloyl-ACP methyl ester carboxylesterase